MAGFSFGIGGGRGVHFDTFGSSSTSRSDSRRGHRHNRPSSPDFHSMDSLASNFMNQSLDDFMDNGFGGSFGTTERWPPGFSEIPGMSRSATFDSRCESHGYPSSAYSGSSGMSSSPYESDGYSTSAYSDFPGMPGDDRTTSSRYRTEKSRPFKMWRTDSHSPERRFARSPSPIFYHEGRSFRTTERAPSPTYTSSRYRSPSSSGYSRGSGSTTFSSTSTAKPRRRSPSPPRRRRSPSPPRKRRARSPGIGINHAKSTRRPSSPPPATFGKPRRAETDRGFRTTERKPEGASSRTHREQSRSRAGPQPSSRKQYNGPYPSRAQSTSHNEYNGAYPSSKHERKPSPPPKPRGATREKSSASRSHSHARSDASRSHSTVKPTRSRSELKKMFDAYNAKWDALSRSDKDYPLPASARELYKLNFLGGAATNGKWSHEEILVANVQVIYLAGFGMSGTIREGSDTLSVRVESRNTVGAELANMKKWLSRKEQPRWHPDRINARTGKDGKLDESVSKRSEVVAMRTAAQRLLAVVDA